MRKQLVLAAAGVLELVDQQMANAVGDAHRGVCWQTVIALQRIQRKLRNLGVVHGRSLCKNHLQLSRSPAQQYKTSAHNLPVFFRIVCRRQLANRGESCFESRNSRKVCNQIEESCFFGFALLGKSVTDVDLFAKAAVAGE